MLSHVILSVLGSFMIIPSDAAALAGVDPAGPLGVLPLGTRELRC